MASLPRISLGNLWGFPDTGSDLLDLSVFQFDRGGTAEDRDGDLEPGLLLVHFLDHAGEGGEGAIGDPDLLAHLEGDGGLRPLNAFLHLIDDPFRLGLADRLRLAAAAQEAGDLRRILHEA